MNNREFEVKQEILNEIVRDYAEGHTLRAIDRLCWFCNGLLGKIKELEDNQVSFSQETTKEGKQ